MTKTSRREHVNWGTLRRGWRRPRRRILQRANVVIVGLLVFYAAVAVAVIHGRNWRPARPCAAGACGCGRVCTDADGPTGGLRSGAIPADGRKTR